MTDPNPIPDALDEEPMERPGADDPIEPAPFPGPDDEPHDDDATATDDVVTTDDLLGTPDGERSDDPQDGSKPG